MHPDVECIRMDLKRCFEEATLGQLIRWWHGEDVPGWSSQTSLFLSKTATAIMRHGAPGVRFFKSQLNSDDPHKRYIALSKLAHKDCADAEVVSSLVSAFRDIRDQKPEVAHSFQVMALDGLAEVGQFPLGRDEAAPLLGHENKWLAASAMAYLSRVFPAETVGILRTGLHSAGPVVRGRACTEIAFRKVTDLQDEAIALLKDPEQYVVNCAQIVCDLM